MNGNGNRFVKTYVDEVTAREAQAVEHQRAVMADGLPKFMKNCKIWLGEMWDECQIGTEFTAYKQGEGVYFALPFTWEGMEGIISSQWWGRQQEVQRNACNRRVMASLSLGMGSGKGYGDFRNGFELPVVGINEFCGGFYNETAVAPDAYKFGAFLVEMLGKKEKYDQIKEGQREAKIRNIHNGLNNDIVFAGTHQAVRAAYEKAVSEFPEDREYWELQMQKRTLQLTEAIENEEAKKKAQKDWQDELERLKKLAEEDFKPFTIYRVRYGAKAQNEGEEWGTSFYETEDWSPDPAAGANGLWRVLRFGSEIPARIINLIAVEEHLVESPHDVPYGVLGKKYFESEKYEGVSAEAWDLSPVLPEAA